MALSGMTGFARVEAAEGPWSWAVEVRSVNGRNLETRFRGPPGFEGLERVAREAAQARFARGQISIALQSRRAEASQTVRINPATSSSPPAWCATAWPRRPPPMVCWPCAG
jgi:uncharacterized protein (TIGR00255 family)